MESQYFLLKNNCLFLWLNDKEFHAIEAKKRGIEVAQVYKSSPDFLRLIRRIQLELKISWIKPWLNPWFRKLGQFDTIILHASKITPLVAKFIRNSQPNMRIIIWYWNPVDKTIPISEFTKYNCEVWSFDEEDCKKYGLKYNTQYYFNDFKLDYFEIKQDVFFVGADKGRMDTLLSLKNRMDNLAISNNFHITSSGEKKKDSEHIYKERINYEEVLKQIASSKAILDIVSEKQSGLTLRPLEALFFKKKLITNEISIVSRDFYQKENIFILGIDKLENLSVFLETPFVEVSRNILERYDINSWLDRFFK